MPRIPDVPAHRTAALTVRKVLDQGRAALHAAHDALHELDDAPTRRQLALIRQVIHECRRSTFVLQKLSSRAMAFDAWYAPRRKAMVDDPLMRYFHNMRTVIEKEGMPGVLAELVDRQSGAVLADVACFEDRHGVFVTGAGRAEANLPPGPLAQDASHLSLRNFRLPDPPLHHRGSPLTDLRFSALADLAIAWLWTDIFEPAQAEFGDVPTT